MMPASGDTTKEPMFRKMISLLPKHYATPVTSSLKVTVNANGPNDFNLELTDDPPSGK
jgi:hypothetical protein